MRALFPVTDDPAVAIAMMERGEIGLHDYDDPVHDEDERVFEALVRFGASPRMYWPMGHAIAAVCNGEITMAVAVMLTTGGAA